MEKKEIKEMSIKEVFDTFFIIKENPKRLVAKLHGLDKKNEIKFLKSVIVPTTMYPLSCSDFRIFNHFNCKKCDDEKILECFNKVHYESGHCYRMADELKGYLVNAGYDAKIYVGWLFPSFMETPIHHAWVVVGDCVLDLQDDWNMINANNEKFEGKNIGECRNLLADFKNYCQRNKIPHSIRCAPVGIPYIRFYYIGCEVSCGEVGRIEYRNLVKKYPKHDCEKMCINNSGITISQLIEKSLL